MMTSTDHRKLEEAIRRGVQAAIREALAPIMETPDFQKRLAMHIAARCAAAGVRKPEGAAPLLRETAPIALPWSFGTGPGRRLTQAGIAEMRRLAEQRLSTGEIARALGVTTRAVNRHIGTREHIRPSQAEREAVAAEKRRAYQRERLRKVRGEKKPEQQPNKATPPAPAATTVVVVPAAVVPAPRQPTVQQVVEALKPKVAEKRAPVAPPPAPVKPKAEPQVIITTTNDVRAWLIASLKAGGMTQLQAMDRVGFMTHDQALAEANQRRLRAGYPPFAFVGTRSAA